MALWWALLSLAFSHLSSEMQSEKEDTLLLVQMLSRHGDRAPVRLYPNNPNPKSAWPEGLGKLTPLGLKQHYSLGKYLRSMYKGFITSNPNEVLANSSASDRCLRSAQATLASLYAPQGRWKVLDDLNWQPISVFYHPKKTDKYLNFGSECPRYWIETERVFGSEEVQKYVLEHRPMLENLTHYAGFPVANGLNGLLFHDTLAIEKKYNLTTPEWVEGYWDELGEFAEENFKWMCVSPVQQRLRSGPLLQEMIENMRRKIDGSAPDLKVQLFNSHDLILAALLNSLNFSDTPRPPLCATMLFELHQLHGGEKAVRLLYLNSTSPERDVGEPYTLVLDGCSEFCPLEEFIDRTRQAIPENWEQECQVEGGTSGDPGFMRSIRNPRQS